MADLASKFPTFFEADRTIREIWRPEGELYLDSVNAPTRVDLVLGGRPVQVYRFSASAFEAAAVTWIPPQTWNGGTVRYRAFWRPTTTGAGNISFNLIPSEVADNESFPSHSAVGGFEDTSHADTGKMHISPWVEVTLEDAEVGDFVVLEFHGRGGSAQWTTTAAMDLIAIEFEYITNTFQGVGADELIHNNVAGEFAAVTEKTAIVPADILLLEDSEDSNNKKKSTVANAVDARVVAVAGDTLNGKHVYSGLISDDSVWEYDFSGNAYGNIILTTNFGGTDEGGVLAIRATTGTIFCDIIVAGAPIESTTGALTGTTGTDGKITVSIHTDRKLYIENRMGTLRGFYVTINVIEP